MVHGGISDSTDLDLIRSLDRGKYVSLLRPPILENALPGTEVIDKVEWKQVSHRDLSASFLPPKTRGKIGSEVPNGTERATHPHHDTGRGLSGFIIGRYVFPPTPPAPPPRRTWID